MGRSPAGNVTAVRPAGASSGIGAAASASLAGNSANSVRRLHLSNRTATAANPAGAVFAAINSARQARGLAPLAWNAGLARSAHLHNVAMVRANTLSHQVGDEPSLLAREKLQGVSAQWAGENVGRTSAAGIAGALDLEARMLAERAPDDGHRQNLLSATARSVGIDVLSGPGGPSWLTEDFSDQA